MLVTETGQGDLLILLFSEIGIIRPGVCTETLTAITRI